MKKYYLSIALSLSIAFSVLTHPSDAATVRNRYIVPKIPAPTQEVKENIEKYKAGNYVGAMIGLEDIVKKDLKNELALYYLALSYTKLGYNEEAMKVYGDLSLKAKNDVIKYYSGKASVCLQNPEGEECINYGKPPVQEETEQEGEKQEPTDIEKFILSGKKIHPAAMDAITKERMERRLQEEQYKRMQQQNEGVPLDIQSYNSRPTNEEIVAALDTLSKIGLNPFDQRVNNLNYLNNFQNPLISGLDYQNAANLFLYSQMNQNYGSQFNGFTNYLTDYGL